MRLRGLSIGLIVLALTGCADERAAHSTSFIDRLRGIGGPMGPDAVFVEFAVIERPAGNQAMNHDVWTNIDEVFLPSDTRTLLDQNALRVGVVGGLAPPELDAMLANPKSSVGHRQRRLYVNNPAVLTINGPVDLAEYKVQRSLNDNPETVKYEQARFSISITPHHASDGRITLKCVPEMDYQDKKYWLPTGATGPGWLGNRPSERYELMKWEVTMTPREFLLIGTKNEKGNWLGNQIFGGQQGNEKVQRLLIVRTGRLTPDDTGWEPSAGPGKDGIVPLASQASVSVTRGQKP